jgi:hypothetical protein
VTREPLPADQRSFQLKSWTESLNPTASVPTHQMVAWMMWVAVGLALFGFGAWWLWSAAPAVAPWTAVGAVLAGIVKSRLVLDRVTRGVVTRIRSRGDGVSLVGFLSLRTWGLIILMMAAGHLLRGSLTRAIIGPLYMAVGTALCYSSRFSWRAWRESRRGD